MNLHLLRILAFTWVVVATALVGLSAVLRVADGSFTVGVVVVAVIGILVLVAIGWVRQRPIRPNDEATYFRTSLIKLSLAESIGLIGFALSVTLGPWWLAAVGVAFSLVGLTLSLPSNADRERHELLYLV